MELKDIVTISVSGLAVILSLIAFVVSYVRGQREQLRAIRQQLTETTDKIAETQLEFARLASGEAKDNVAMQQQIDSILSQRMLALLNQAVYLTNRAPAVVTEVDYNTIAVLSANNGDFVLADDHFRKAIQSCHNDFSRSSAMRSYGSFLFNQRRFEEGRNTFREAVTLIRGADNSARIQKGFIYAAWSWSEMNDAKAPRQAADAFENAQSEFAGIENEAMRQSALSRLELAKGSPMPPLPQVSSPPRAVT